MKLSMLSPIIFFAYKRPFHTYQSLIALTKNEESIESDLIAYIDGPTDIRELHLIDSVEKIISSFRIKFKSLIIHRSKINKGLASNIIGGISNELKVHESAIILEDDISVSTTFLKYMNNALKIYKNNHLVWHINAFNLPIRKNPNKDFVFTRLMYCWGWGTWRDRWDSFENDYLSRDPYYISSVFDKNMRRKLDLGLKFSLFWSQVEENKKDKNTWAIFWYCHIFKNKGLCLMPLSSLVKNIGLDGSGINCGETLNMNQNILNEEFTPNFPSVFIEDNETIEEIKSFYKRINLNIFRRILRKSFRIFKVYK